ncbi:hypothetical protein ACO0K9_01085 [Undibacterium sp. Ji50W]|uniref:hypothetical protein n=1 Tax=Undibacterium sp. Ji50W TaxID=3413041 RepID=UPI003BF2E98B
MTTSFTEGDHVAFTCHILGQVHGVIKTFTSDISNGQRHAVIELHGAHLPGCMCSEPVVNLRKVS